MNKKPTFEELQQIACDDPAIYMVLKMIDQGEFTREEGLVYLVLFLAAQKKEMLAKVLEIGRSQPRYFYSVGIS